MPWCCCSSPTTSRVGVLVTFAGTEAAQNGNLLATLALGLYMSIFIVYGFDTAGTFGEETVDAEPQAPRGVLSSILVSGAVGIVFLLAVILATPDMPATIAEGQAGGFPIATIITGTLTHEVLSAASPFGEMYLFVILASVFVCTMAIQGAASRLMFSMGRDRHLPGGGVWGHVSRAFKTPANAAVAVGVIAALPILVSGPYNGFVALDLATGLIYLSYFLCNIGVFMRAPQGLAAQGGVVQPRELGHDHQRAGADLRRPDDLNIALWNSAIFGDFGTEGRVFWNPTMNAFLSGSAPANRGLPAWPLFETMVGLLLVLGGHLLPSRRPRQGARRRGAPTSTGEGTSADVSTGSVRRRAVGAHAPAAPSSGDADERRARRPARRRAADELVAAMQRVPELAGRELTLTAAVGRHHQPQLPGRRRRDPAERYVIRLAGNDTHLLGISREVEHAATAAAAGGRRGARGRRVHPARGLSWSPGSSRARRVSRAGRPRAGDARAGGRLACAGSTTGRRSPALFVPLRIVEAYRALAADRGVPIPAEYELAAATAGASSSHSSPSPVEPRPCHNDLLSANFIDDGERHPDRRLGVRRMGDPFFDLGNFSINHELPPDEDAALLRGLRRRGPRPDRLARLSAHAGRVGLP